MGGGKWILRSGLLQADYRRVKWSSVPVRGMRSMKTYKVRSSETELRRTLGVRKALLRTRCRKYTVIEASVQPHSRDVRKGRNLILLWPQRLLHICRYSNFSPEPDRSMQDDRMFSCPWSVSSPGHV